MKIITTIKFALLAIFTGLFLTASAQAATYTVNTTADNGTGGCTTTECTLREAIAAANANADNDVIEFDATVFNSQQTIALNGTQLAIIENSGKLTINGTGADKLTISGNGVSRVFRVSAGADAEINALTISNGNGGSLGGGIENRGRLSLNNLTITNSSATEGGGIFNSGPGVNLMVNNTTISGNSARIGGGIGNYNRSTITLNNTTVSGNSKRPSDSQSFGGGIYLENSSTLTLNAATISNNSTPQNNGGGGILNNGGTLFINNSIIANSASGGDCVRANGTINASYSLIEGGTTCVNGTNSNNLTGDPNLGPLQNNGGSTFTHALLPGSIAIDAGNSTLTTDQRGLARPVDNPSIMNATGGNGSDIGSFEVQPPDSDGDGINDFIDNCPNTANADQADNDMDMIGDVCDDDDDNDGVLDGDDAFPFDPNESEDTDGDGIGNNADTDDDNDGQTDANETACGSNPLDATSKSPDADNDSIPDCVDPDDDNDDIPDTCDIDSNPGAEDFDRDGIVDGSGCDTVIGPPVDKDQCKNGGFRHFNNPTFRNQGQCVSFVESSRP